MKGSIALSVVFLAALVGCGKHESAAPASAATTTPADSAPTPEPEAKTDESTRAENKRKAREVCKEYSTVSAKIMEGRQSGVAMSKTMEIFTGEDGNIDPLMESIIMEAYEAPRMSVETNQQRYIEDFENTIFLRCMQQTPLNK
jgi:hypothetical protein